VRHDGPGAPAASTVVGHMGAGYVVESRLGRGGMGVVDLAVRSDGTRVALKRLALGGSSEALASARARIRREAEVLGKLDHRRIVGLLDVVDDGDDVILVMPWMQGGSLADRVSRFGPLPPDEVERLADHLLGALAAAHRAGVVHRDIKPANILFDEESRPHLADFGVATARDVTAGLTGDGRAIGTPGFISPEVARGESAGPASDVFSLGATLRWAATGSGPYGEGDRDVLLWRAARGRIESSPRTLPDPLRRQLDRMLDPRADRRPTAAALAGGPEGTVEQPTGSPSGRRRLGLTVGVLAAGGVALSLALLVARPPAGADSTDDTAATSTDRCVDLPYQRCGEAPAPGTDGQRCIDDRADYDGDAANGCEAQPDGLDGTALGTVEATIVPIDDIDEFPVEVADNFHFSCDGRVTFDLTAPPGISLRLEVLDESGEVVGEATSADGVASQLRIVEPQCVGDDSGTLTARVTAIGSERVAEPYLLERSGSW
jgi:hypothetical protein